MLALCATTNIANSSESVSLTDMSVSRPRDDYTNDKLQYSNINAVFKRTSLLLAGVVDSRGDRRHSQAVTAPSLGSRSTRFTSLTIEGEI